MHLAIQTPTERTTFPALRDVWQAADELGLRSAFTFDHLVALNPLQGPGADEPVPHDPQLEGWTTLAALAAGTRRLQVGTLVSSVTHRSPALLAKMAVTLDHVTDGRAVLGLGAGWHAAEHAAFGVPFPPAAARLDLLEETLVATRMLWTQPVADLDGRHVRLRSAVFEPKPVRPGGIPLLVGGNGPRLRRLAARHADAFNGFAPPWGWAALNAELDTLLEAAGRHPRELERTAFVFCELSGDRAAEDELVATFVARRGGDEEEARARLVLGPPDHMAAVLRSYRDAGVDTVVLALRPPFPVDGLERVAREVLPAVAATADPAPTDHQGARR